MSDSECAPSAQRTKPKLITAKQALALALEQFPGLAAAGILNSKSKFAAAPIDLAHIERALVYLAPCRKSKAGGVHSFDLRAAIGGVSLGAVIAAAVGLGFEVHSWVGVTSFAPHAMIRLDRADVANTTA